MNGTLLKIKEVIHAVARDEDLALRRLCGQGIMSIPELTFTYQVAKAILMSPQEILGSPNFKWQMNKGIGAGLTDLVLDLGKDMKGIAIEFKIGGTPPSYIKDLQKLAKLNGTAYDRVFCALMDVFSNDILTHSRVKAVEGNGAVPVTRVGEYFDFFSTLHSSKTQTCCLIGMWMV